MKKLIAFAVAVGLVLAGFALWSYPITAVENGMAKGVDPSASAANDNGSVRTLKVGDDVAIGETVETGPTGQVQLLFDDQTELVIGPKSKLRVDDYFVRNDGSAGKFAVAALAGTFRFITGTSPHDKYKITTPTGTIGVRGTAFDFSVLQRALNIDLNIGPSQWVTSVLLFNGAVRLCSLSNVCVVITAVCGFGAETEIDALLIENNRAAKALFRGFFPYAADQTPLLRPYWIANARQCIAASTVTTTSGPAQTLSGGSNPPPPTTNSTPTTTSTPTTSVVPTTTTTPTTTGCGSTC